MTKKSYKKRLLRDPVWGDIDISDPVIKALIDLPVMQRLRRIEMTDFAYFAFPGLSATRFEHSIGTLHLLRTLYYPGQYIFDERKKTVNWEYTLGAMGALFHHVLVPPFSYATVPLLDNKNFKVYFSTLSGLMAEYLLDELKDKIIQSYGLKNTKLKKDFQRWEKFAIRVIGQKERPLGYPGAKKEKVNLYKKLYNRLFVIPDGANFLEACSRNLHMLGIGKSFDYKMVAESRRQKRRQNILPDYLKTNIVSLIHNVELLINMVFEDKKSMYCSALLQKLLLDIYEKKDGSLHEKDFMKPLSDFMDKFKKGLQ